MQATLLFDLDGTISDPIVGIAASINFALQQYGFEPRAQESLRQYVGPPLEDNFRDLTGGRDEALIKQLSACYREHYGDYGYQQNTLYPDIPELLEQLAQRNVTMALCTAKRTDLAEKVLDMFELTHYFQFVSGGGGIAKHQQIAQLIQEQRITDQAIMIGDRKFDISAAHDNGLSAAGVLWGYGSYDELSALQPRFLFSQPHEVLQLVSF